jgi:uncharacterized membrane protein (UPF0127 family)
MHVAQIVNISKGIDIASKAQIAASMGQRIKGLLGRAGLEPDEAMVLKPCTSVHTIFMRFPIDVLFLDKNMQIIRLIQNMPPYRLSPFVWASHLAIELPAGKISQTNTQLGDRVRIQS